MSKRSQVVLFLAVLLCFFGSASSAVPMKPTLQISVKLNGTKLVGLIELSSRYAPNGLPRDRAGLEQALQRSIVDFKRGSSADLSIYLLRDGLEKDVTLDPGVTIESTLGQLEFVKGKLLATPARRNSQAHPILGPVVLSVYYFSDDSKKIFGFDQFYIRLVD
jgi:hypothetical protein